MHSSRPMSKTPGAPLMVTWRLALIKVPCLRALVLSCLLSAAGCTGRVEIEWPPDNSVLLERAFMLRVRLSDLESRGYQLDLVINDSPFLHATFHSDSSESFSFELDLPAGSHVLQVTVGADGEVVSTTTARFELDSTVPASIVPTDERSHHEDRGPTSACRDDRCKVRQTAAGEEGLDGMVRRKHVGSGADGAGLFSSVRCTGGVQALDAPYHRADYGERDWEPQAHPTDARQRICAFQNVCWFRGSVVFFEDPEDAALSEEGGTGVRAFGGEMLALSYLDLSPPSGDEGLRKMPLWAPEVMQGPIPSQFEWGAAEVYALDSPTFSDNFGHFLLDNVAPVYGAAQTFSLGDAGAAQLTLFHPCALPGEAGGGSRAAGCRRNYEDNLRLFFDRPVLYLEHLPPFNQHGLCLPTLLAGQGSALSLRFQTPRAPLLRAFRDAIRLRAALPPAPPPASPPPPSHSLLVLSKRHVGMNPPHWPRACPDTLAALSSLRPLPDHNCLDPSQLSFHLQVAVAHAATALVVEHGTVSYVALFARDGAGCLSVGLPPFKEAHVLLQAAHVQVRYLDVRAVPRLLPASIRSVLNAAAPWFGLPRTALRS